MRWFGLLAALVLGTPSTAEATTGLTWNLDGRTVRYLLDVQVALPVAEWLFAAENLEARVTRFRLQTILACHVVEELGTRGWMLRCDIEDVAFAAAPLQHELGMVKPIAVEWDESGVHLQPLVSGVPQEGALGRNRGAVSENTRQEGLLTQSRVQLVV